MRNFVHTLLLFLGVCILPVMGWGQTGTLRGKVSDGSTGEILLGATVRLMIDGQVRGGAYTDLEGRLQQRLLLVRIRYSLLSYPTLRIRLKLPLRQAK